MIARTLVNYPHVWASCLALGLFIAFFLVMLGWVFRKNSKSFYAELAWLPLENAGKGREYHG